MDEDKSYSVLDYYLVCHKWNFGDQDSVLNTHGLESFNGNLDVYNKKTRYKNKF